MLHKSIYRDMVKICLTQQTTFQRRHKMQTSCFSTLAIFAGITNINRLVCLNVKMTQG